MKKLTFTIGTQSANSKEFYDIDMMIDDFAQCFECATITKCLGCYKYLRGTICKEPSFKIEIILFDDDYNKQVEICNKIANVARLYSQESYLFEIQTSNSYDASIVYC